MRYINYLENDQEQVLLIGLGGFQFLLELFNLFLRGFLSGVLGLGPGIGAGLLIGVIGVTLRVVNHTPGVVGLLVQLVHVLIHFPALKKNKKDRLEMTVFVVT